jgi:hypothetical protein
MLLLQMTYNVPIAISHIDTIGLLSVGFYKPRTLLDQAFTIAKVH